MFVKAFRVPVENIYAFGGHYMNKMYFNVICEELSVTGGKIIYIDENKGDIEEVHKLVVENMGKYPNAKWELYPIIIN